MSHDLPAPAELSYGALKSRYLDSLDPAKVQPGAPVVVDLRSVPRLSGLQAAALLRLVIEGKERDIEVRFAGISPEARQAFAGLGLDLLNPKTIEPADLPLVERVGEQTLGYYEALRSVLSLIGEVVYFTFVAPFRGKPIKWDRTIEQILKIGADGVPIVMFLSFLIGTVLALNGAAQLRQFGAAIYIADLVGVAMTREMAPLITAIIVCGRSGSAITAELGTMMVSEEIDAMRTMALSPGRFLLVPRALALLVAMPCLTTLSTLAGIFGGYWVGVILLQLGSANYIDETGEALLISDVLTGLTKSIVFAVIIALVACYRGFHVQGGAEGVGTATTSSVVTAIVLCIFANAIFTAVFYYIG